MSGFFTKLELDTANIYIIDRDAVNSSKLQLSQQYFKQRFQQKISELLAECKFGGPTECVYREPSGICNRNFRDYHIILSKDKTITDFGTLLGSSPKNIEGYFNLVVGNDKTIPNISPTATPQNNCGEIWSVCIKSSERGKGTGKKMLQTVINYFNLQKYWLGVWLENPDFDSAVGLYASLGFSNPCIRYYTPLENAIPEMAVISMIRNRDSLGEKSITISRAKDIQHSYRLGNSGTLLNTQTGRQSSLLNDSPILIAGNLPETTGKTLILTSNMSLLLNQTDPVVQNLRKIMVNPNTEFTDISYFYIIVNKQISNINSFTEDDMLCILTASLTDKVEDNLRYISSLIKTYGKFIYNISSIFSDKIPDIQKAIYLNIMFRYFREFIIKKDSLLLYSVDYRENKFLFDLLIFNDNSLNFISSVSNETFFFEILPESVKLSSVQLETNNKKIEKIIEGEISKDIVIKEEFTPKFIYKDFPIKTQVFSLLDSKVLNDFLLKSSQSFLSDSKLKEHEESLEEKGIHPKSKLHNKKITDTIWYLSTLYLVLRYFNDIACIPLYEKSQLPPIGLEGMFDYGLDAFLWDSRDGRGKLLVSKDLGNRIKKYCGKSGKRFVIIPLMIRTMDGGHANILIYDRKRDLVERFEPHGLPSYRGIDNLDKYLEAYFKEIIDPAIQFYDPSKSCPIIGFQTIESSATTKQAMDPAGFCVYWSMFYMWLRLKYPDAEPSTLQKDTINELNKIMRGDPTQPETELVKAEKLRYFIRIFSDALIYHLVILERSCLDSSITIEDFIKCIYEKYGISTKKTIVGDFFYDENLNILSINELFLTKNIEDSSPIKKFINKMSSRGCINMFEEEVIPEFKYNLVIFLRGIFHEYEIIPLEIFENRIKKYFDDKKESRFYKFASISKINDDNISINKICEYSPSNIEKVKRYILDNFNNPVITVKIPLVLDGEIPADKILIIKNFIEHGFIPSSAPIFETLDEYGKYLSLYYSSTQLYKKEDVVKYLNKLFSDNIINIKL